jgi:hypothetical protein
MIDSETLGTLSKLRIDYSYLQNRVTSELAQIKPGEFQVKAIEKRSAIKSEIDALPANDIIVIIIGRGQDTFANSLAPAGPKGDQKQRSILQNVCNGNGAARGVTVAHHVCFVGTAELTDAFEGMGVLSENNGRNTQTETTLQKSQREAHDLTVKKFFMSDVLVHEIGHAVANTILRKDDPERDHKTGGVMSPQLSKDGIEHHYTVAFCQSIREKI